MSDRFLFHLSAPQETSVLPPRIQFVRRPTETQTHILLKVFGFLLFQRERLQIEPHIDDPFMPFVPDVAQFDYQGRIALWVECGECAITKLDRLAVKAPEAEIWSVKRSVAEAEDLGRRIAADRLRRGRYGIVGLESAMMEEISGLCRPRNDVVWHRLSWQDGQLQFEFNGLWFDSEFRVFRH